MNSNYHVDMKYSIPKPKSDIKPHSKVKDFVVMTAATAVMACGISFFKFENTFAFGGITGIAVLVAKTGVISSGDFNFVCNIVLLVLGFLVLGKGFGAKTFYCSMLLSFLLSILERVYPMDGPLTNQPVLELMFAIAVPAFGSAILFNMGASSGGTDIVAMILKKYTGYDIGRVLMLSDVAIAVAGVFVFGMETGLFSILGLVLRSVITDNFIESFNLSKCFNVVCSNPEPICNFIIRDLHRGATVYTAQGVFSGKKKYIVLTALNRPQAVRLRNFIKETEPGAFILISNTSEIIGRGFHTV